MQEFLSFWKKDFINKLIIIHTSLLFIGVTALVVFLFLMPEGKTFGGFLGNLFPTPTTEPKVLMTQAAEKAIVKAFFATASVPPTVTTQPLVEQFYTETPTPEGFTLLPTETEVPSATLMPVPTATTAGKPTAVSAPASAGMACLPKGVPDKGRVLDVISGNELKVLVGEYAYTVRYIGVEAPADAGFGLMATNTNGSLTFGKDILLYKDALDVDSSGRFLRWVVLDGKMPAIDLLEKGLLTTFDPAPNSSCAQLLKDAENIARDSRQGVWSVR